jgi:aspartate kinase
MGVIVQKYGGSSVATPDKLRQVAARIVGTRRLGHQVVVVVSAMGNTTNELLALARSVSPNPQRRELDMLITTGERISMALLSMAIHDLGCPAVSFTGSQSGIITSEHHTNARILRITPTRIQQALALDQIVIVAGFQGVSERREITSLGRGGSDTTAVALAAALGADYAEICSDVDGVYTADPRVVPDARRLDDVSYEEMQVLADAGAKVLNAEAVEWARRHGIEIRCVATAGDAAVGTPVRADAATVLHPRVVGVTAHPGLFLLEPSTPSDAPPAELEATLAAHGAAESEVWLLPSGWSALVPKLNVHGLDAFRDAVLGLGGVRLREDLTLVTVAGRALSAPPGHARRAAQALAVTGIAVRGRLVDAGRAAFLVDADAASAAVRTLHAALLGDSAP